ncbi:MAG: D-glycero-beta-D-manno-heptose-7-phosphate kinase [Leptospirales bacterium]|nr:D-glycero-beta-D-manno-heptose-7-phosphate kinase [Leptospirales bacterium]
MNQARAAEILEKLSNIRVLVIGDFMIDEYRYGRAERLSPEAPVPVILEHSVSQLPGGAGNVVKNLSALEIKGAALGVRGTDSEGDVLLKLLEGCERLSLLADPSRPTTKKMRIVAGTQQICRLDQEDSSNVSAEMEKQIKEAASSMISQSNAVIISDYDKGVVTEGVIQSIITESAKNNAFVAVDPQVSRFACYQKVGVLTPNHHEAGRFIGKKLETDSQVEAGGREIMERLHPAMLLITRGEKGMSLFEGNSCRHFPTRAREVFDVTGAGDTVITVFTVVIAAGGTPAEAVFLSNLAAGMVVARLGAATVTRKEILSGHEFFSGA